MSDQLTDWTPQIYIPLPINQPGTYPLSMLSKKKYKENNPHL